MTSGAEDLPLKHLSGSGLAQHGHNRSDYCTWHIRAHTTLPVRELDQPHLYTLKGVSRMDREILDVVMLSVHQEPTSCRELFNPHEICTLYARTCTIIMASGCSDPTRNLINLSSLPVAQSALRQTVNSLSKRSLRELVSYIYGGSGFYCLRFVKYSPKYTKRQVQHYRKHNF